MQQSSGQSQPLTLTAGKVAAPFHQFGIQTSLAFQKFIQVYFFQYGLHLFFGRHGSCHQKIFPDRSLKQITIVGHHCHVGQQAVLLNPGQFLSSNPDRSAIAPIPAGEQAGNGTLSTAGGSHQGDESILRKLKRHLIQNLPLPVVGKAYIAEYDRRRAIPKTFLPCLPLL